MNKSDQINELVTAVSKLQSSIKGVDQGGTNPHFKSKYSTLSDIWDAIREPLGKNGLSVFQELRTSETAISVITLITHSSGQWMEFGPLEVPFARKDAQSIGSACSYAKRYALSAALGITSSTEDDDGESAQPERKSGISKINEAQMELLENLGKNNPGVRANILKYWKAESFYDLKGRDVSIADINGMIKALKGE